MTGNSRIILIVALLFSICLPSCIKSKVYYESEKIPGYVWNAGNDIKFRAEIDDTAGTYDINLIIRTDNSYPYRNMFLFIRTTSPAFRSIKDTVEYFLADQNGNWYGSGLGDINDLSVPFKTNIIFPEKGNYTFSISHGMRDRNLEGVTDIGMLIRKRKP